MSNQEIQNKRPLSPHLSIYKPIPTMVASIVNRMTGAALYFGILLFVCWIFAAATSTECFDSINSFFGSFIGRLLLFGFTWALIHHMVGGIRHLVWDTGRGFDKDLTTKLAKASWIVSIGVTFLIWFIAYAVR